MEAERFSADKNKFLVVKVCAVTMKLNKSGTVQLLR